MKRDKIQISGGGAKALFLSAIAFFLAMGLCADLSAQTSSQGNYATLKGVVLEFGTENVPVEFASIQILPQGSMSATNNRGEFTFDRLSPGRIELKIHFLGMESIDTTLNLIAGRVTELRLRMRYSSFRLNEVSVVATESKAGQATASNISRQAMDHLQTSSLSDILQLLPGGVTIKDRKSVV